MFVRFAPVALGLALTGSAWASDPVVVELAPRARVAGGVVRLGDIAHLGSGSRAALAWLSLGRAPEAGSRRTIEVSEIQAALGAAGFAPSAVALRGAVKVVVESETVALLGKTLADMARVFAAQQLDAPGQDLELEPIAPLAPAEVTVPMGRESSALHARWSSGAPSSLATTVVVSVDVVIDGENRATVEQGFHLRRFVRGLVATRAVMKGEVLDARNCEVGRIERAQVGEDVFADRAEILGATARRDLKPGTTLARADVALPLVVKKGEHVQVSITKGTLRVMGEGTALRDAARGETVSVTTRVGHDPLVGRATSEGRVEVDLEAVALAPAATPTPTTQAPTTPSFSGGQR